MASRRNPLFGPRVSICSFGPRIEHPKCGYCTNNASIPCTTCNAIWYCTVSCQKLDRIVHNMICQSYADFVTENPCPADTFEKKYKLGLLLPVDSKQFQLAWIANGSRGKSVATFLQYYDQERINTRKTLVDCNMTSKQFDHTIFLAVRGDFLTDNSPPNACIDAIMLGNLNYTLTGPVAVVSESGHGQSGNAQHFQPCDLRILIDFLFNYEGKPKIDIGHACGNQSKGTSGVSLNRFKVFFKGKARDWIEKSTTTFFDVEEQRTYRQRVESLTDSDWTTDFVPGHEIKRPTSSIYLGNYQDDEISINRPASFIFPDFLPDWIVQSPSIYVGPPPHSQTAPTFLANKENIIKESTSMENIEITPIAKASNQVYQKDDFMIKNSLEMFNQYNLSRLKIITPSGVPIISQRSSPPLITTTSSFETRAARKNKDTLDIDTKNSFFSHPKSKSAEINRDDYVHQRGMEGSIMSPWVV